MSAAPRKPHAPRSSNPRGRTSSRRSKRTIALVAAASAAVLVAILLVLNSDSRQANPTDDAEVADDDDDDPPHLVDLSLTPADEPISAFDHGEIGEPEGMPRDDMNPGRLTTIATREEWVSDAFGGAEDVPRPRAVSGPFAAEMLQAGSFSRATRNLVGYGAPTAFPAYPTKRLPGRTPAAEDAIDNAIDWLLRHQLPRSGWSFVHSLRCGRLCSDRGSLEYERNAATSLALLVLIRAGGLRLGDPHFDAIRMGLFDLTHGVRHALKDPQVEAYSFAITTAALCEAYRALNDIYWDALRANPETQRNVETTLRGETPWAPLAEVVPRMVDHIVAHQHDEGGWRYAPQTPGDVSVTTWMLAALKSAQAAGLAVPEQTVARAQRFLSAAASRRGGALFYYRPGIAHDEERSKATTAMGWLCRLSMGAARENPAVLAGADRLLAWGPQIGEEANFYYNYYATQVMHVVGGKHWSAWHGPLRDYLVAAQNRAPRDHAFGSWYVASDAGSNPGGRLYCTCLAALTLQTICASPAR